MTDTRITQLTEASTLQSGDYAVIDSATDGTRKIDLRACVDSAQPTPISNAEIDTITAS